MALRTLRSYWDSIFSRHRASSGPGDSPAPRPEELERRIEEISGERRALAEEVHQVRAELAHARDEDHRKLIELESLGARYETSREADSRTIHDLERRLAALESERDQAREQARSLAASLAETTGRLERTDHQVKELQAGSVEQAGQFREALAAASRRQEDTDTHVRELAARLDSERQDFLNTVQGLTSRLQRQDVRMNWTMSVAGAALLLGAVAGVILLWEMQRNTVLLSSMSRDIKELMVAVNSGLDRQQAAREEMQQVLAPPVIPPPVTRPPVAAPPENSAVPEPEPEPRVSVAPTGKPATRPNANPYFLGSALNRGRQGAFDIRSLLEKRQGYRGSRRDEARGVIEETAGQHDASHFFAENARVDGMVSLPSGVQYRVIKPGSGKSPTRSDSIVVAYVGALLDGTVFDETYSTGLTSTFSMQEVSPGWQEVLSRVEEGAEFELYVPAGLTLGRGGGNRGLPAQETHIYLIELLEVVREAAPVRSAPEN